MCRIDPQQANILRSLADESKQQIFAVAIRFVHKYFDGYFFRIISSLLTYWI